MGVLVVDRGIDVSLAVEPGGKTIFVGQRLPITQLDISQKCLGGCNYCGINAKGTDPQMSWDLFEALIASKQVAFIRSEELHLGDGEVLIYRDEKQDKTLVDVIRRLVCDLGLKVHFTTAGLITPNRKTGVDVLNELARLGEGFRERVAVHVSFNLLNPDANPVERYVAQMRETFELIERFARLKINFMFSDQRNLEQATRALERTELVLDEKMHQHRRVSGYERALGNEDYGRLLGFFDVQPTQTTCKVIDSPSANGFSVGPNGIVGASCPGFGTRGSSLGNVYENDAAQIQESYNRFLVVLRQRLGPQEGRRIAVCQVHRNLNWAANLPRSSSPIVKRAVA